MRIYFRNLFIQMMFVRLWSFSLFHHYRQKRQINNTKDYSEMLLERNQIRSA